MPKRHDTPIPQDPNKPSPNPRRVGWDVRTDPETGVIFINGTPEYDLVETIPGFKPAPCSVKPKHLTEEQINTLVQHMRVLRKGEQRTK